MRRRWRELAAGLVGLAVVVVVLAPPLTERREVLAASNASAPVSDIAYDVEAGASRCVRTFVPAGTSAVRVFAGTGGRPGPPLSVRMRAAGRRLTAGRASGGYRGDVPVTIPVRPTLRDASGAEVCIRNEGRPLVWFAGAQPRSSGPIALDAQEIRIDLLLAGARSPLDFAGHVAERAALMKSSLIGSWAIWLALAGAALLPAVAALAIARRPRP